MRGAPAGADPTRERPTLGVAIPTLNEARALPRLLERLFAGARDDRAEQVVVADGGSDDGTPELARAAGCELVLGARGRGRQLAAGARQLDTDLFLFLHADCLPAPGALAALRTRFADPAWEVTGFRQRIPAAGLIYRAIERAASARVACFGMVYGDSGLCVRRELYERSGGFRDLPLFEDVELSRRLRRLARVRLAGECELLVSPRRWQREGVLRCTLRNWILSLGFLVGVSPERLARLYAPNSDPPDSDPTRSSAKEREPEATP